MGREMLDRICDRFLFDFPDAGIDGDGHVEEGVDVGGVRVISVELVENWRAASHNRSSIPNMNSELYNLIILPLPRVKGTGEPRRFRADLTISCHVGSSSTTFENYEEMYRFTPVESVFK